MLRRVRWYHVPIGKGLAETAKGMRKQPYGGERTSGFRLERARSDGIQGQYLERHEWTERVDDPVRGSVDIARVELRHLEFALGTSAPELQIVNPSRALGGFMADLSSIIGEDTEVTPILLSPLVWFEEIASRAPKAIVVSVATTPIALSVETAAEVTLASATEDVRKQLKAFLKGRKFDADRIGVAWKDENETVRCELAQQGRATVRSSTTRPLDLLRDALRSGVAKTRDD